MLFQSLPYRLLLTRCTAMSVLIRNEFSRMRGGAHQGHDGQLWDNFRFNLICAWGLHPSALSSNTVCDSRSKPRRLLHLYYSETSHSQGQGFLGMWFGESDANVRDVLDSGNPRAAPPCVIFVTSLDSMAHPAMRRCAWSSAVLNQLQTEMDGWQSLPVSDTPETRSEPKSIRTICTHMSQIPKYN